MRHLDGFKKFNESSRERENELSDEAKIFIDIIQLHNYVVNEDGSIDVDGDVVIGSIRLPRNGSDFEFLTGLKKLPVKFGLVTGAFMIDFQPTIGHRNKPNDLTTLEGCPESCETLILRNLKGVTNLKGAPKRVTQEMEITSCNLTSLEGFPEECDGCSITFSELQITSLEGLPEEVRSLFVTYTPIKTLRGCPKIIQGEFEFDNTDLTSLEGGPDQVGGLFSCYNSKLENLKGMPKSIGDSVDVRGNQLTSLEGCPQTIYGMLNCAVNNLTNLRGGPKTCEKIDLSDNDLTSLEGLPDGLNLLRVVNNGGLYDPTPLKNLSKNCDISFTLSPIDEIYRCIKDMVGKNSPAVRGLFVGIIRESMEIFLNSLDYNYFRMVGKKPSIIEHRFLEALEEFNLGHNYDRNKLPSYQIVDENLKKIS